MNETTLIAGYHKLIENEYKKVVDPKTKIIKPISKSKEGSLTYSEILHVLKDPKIFKELRERGFLVKLDDDHYRSLHMDVAIRSASIRTYYFGVDYIISPRLEKYYLPIPLKDDRKLLPNSKSVNPYEKNLYRSLAGFFDDSIGVRIFQEILREYFKKGGLDAFQALTLSRLLKENQPGSRKTYVISAPTGAGKTEIFLLYALAKILRAKLNGYSEKILLTYPRKALAVDQTGRIIKMIYIANEVIKKELGDERFLITLGIRDSETKKVQDLKKEFGRTSQVYFRGIPCPLCANDSALVYKMQRGNIVVGCSRDIHEFDFIRATREDMGKRSPDLLVSNLWAVEWRLIERKTNKKDINVGFFENLSLLILDEAHEYTGLSGGLVSGLLRAINETSTVQDFEFILSSATLPKPGDFGRKLTGIPNTIDIDFRNTMRTYGIKFIGKRLVLIGVYDILPMYSWNTYAQLWSIFMSFINYAHSAQRKKYVPQSLIFIENIKEIRRAIRGVEENISLGEPRDHLTIKDPFDPYSYVPYVENDEFYQEIQQSFDQYDRLPQLVNRIGEIHSNVTPKERQRIISELKTGSGTLGSVFSTSTLEIGVDYGRVGFILNSGVDNIISLRQRIGRGGRSATTLRTVLGIILTKRVPSESFVIHDANLWKKLDPNGDYEGMDLPVSSENSQVQLRYELTKALIRMAQNGEKTYSSGRETINSESKLIEFLKKLLKELYGDYYE